eukprot:NODE_293_length_10559_cov_1.046463.p6 type:complete len:211 gc:universal NODE_293_length_10559_cov_1.046463:9093-9725(+)
MFFTFVLASLDAITLHCRADNTGWMDPFTLKANNGGHVFESDHVELRFLSSFGENPKISVFLGSKVSEYTVRQRFKDVSIQHHSQMVWQTENGLVLNVNENIKCFPDKLKQFQFNLKCELGDSVWHYHVDSIVGVVPFDNNIDNSLEIVGKYFNQEIYSLTFGKSEIQVRYENGKLKLDKKMPDFDDKSEQIECNVVKIKRRRKRGQKAN